MGYASSGEAVRRKEPVVSSRTTRTVDSRGRLSLGQSFAGRQVIIQEVAEGELRIIRAEVIPARESWLYKDPEAFASVTRGLLEARSGRTAEAPDLDADIARFEHEDE
jgi:hypothetical protein